MNAQTAGWFSNLNQGTVVFIVHTGLKNALQLRRLDKVTVNGIILIKAST
jgi:hypothetical protein